jgi:hypothetical protein
MTNRDIPVTDAMIAAARQSSDWVADLRDDEISHIIASALQASPPVGGDLVERIEAVLRQHEGSPHYDDTAEAILAALSTPKVKEASVGEGLRETILRQGELDREAFAQLSPVKQQSLLNELAALSPQPATRGGDVEALTKRLTKLYAALASQSKSYDAEAVAEAISTIAPQLDVREADDDAA